MPLRRVLLLTEEQGFGGVRTAARLLRQALVERGWEVSEQPVRSGRPAIWRLLVMAFESEAIIASNNFFPAYWAVLLGLISRRPRIVWVHGPLADVLEQVSIARSLRLLVLQWCYKFASVLVFTSRAAQVSLNSVMRLGALPLQQVIHNPAPEVSQSFLNTGPRAGIDLGFVGRLAKEKRPERLVQMLTHLPDEFRLTLVGDGPLKAQLEDLGRGLGLLGTASKPDRLRFAGQQEISASTYQQWQATVMCSAYEGFPLVALESLAAGVPCVGAPIPALKELLSATCGDWLAPSGDAEALAATIMRLVEQPVQTRRERALAVARLYPLSSFGAQWDAALRRRQCQSFAGPKQVHFVHTGGAYMPEIQAYGEQLSRFGHRCFLHRDPARVPLDADIVWWFCGRVSLRHAFRLRRSIHVHEYASASVGACSSWKDGLKRLIHPRPHRRLFLNDWVRRRMNFSDGVPFDLRDMGVPTAFLRSVSSELLEFDLVYVGEMGRLMECKQSLQALSDAGLSLLLVGEAPRALRECISTWPKVRYLGRIAHDDVPRQVFRARAGLNLMPRRLPLTEQTSTKVLEYLALGLPVLSNRYAWAERIASSHPDRVCLIDAPDQPAAWARAMRDLPDRVQDRRCMESLSWPARLDHLSVWGQLGLAPDSP